MPPDTPTELFDIVDPATGNITGVAPRSVCHATGLWHRAAYIFVSDPAGRLLLQRRAATKDVCPNAWDMSCTEHVSSGESVTEAAVRGLKEELGIRVDAATLGAPLGPERPAILKQGAVWDRELVTTFWLTAWSGGVTPDASEVAGVQWVTPAELRDLAAKGGVTPWLVEELRARPKLLE